ncbi:hypothetical protein F5Y15DRAFT_147429 [Xylariaceae sp. FL0016]|nr:hypothetical protein F5Y15DRAFT_147429 [Xylariaceae sp. FL0016]
MPVLPPRRSAAQPPTPSTPFEYPKLGRSSTIGGNGQRNRYSQSKRDRVAPTIATAKPKARPPTHEGKPGSKAGKLQSGGALDARAILSNPRLQQVTGFLPRKTGLFDKLEPPIDELARLQWVMSLPDTFPAKRPRGNF